MTIEVFKTICRLSQKELKETACSYLTSHNYKVVNEKGFLYAKGDVPVLLVAHMDTVHRERCTEIIESNGKISSPQGIGGDDRCGIYIIMNIIRDLHCSILFCEDEEIGMVGAKQFVKTHYLDHLDVNYIIEFDRKGNNDAVFYDCDNPEFTDFICNTTGFKESFGSFSDISQVAPASGIAAVNLSCGYYKAHTKEEYVIFDEMLNTIEVAKKLITTESKAYEYIESKWTYNYDGWMNKRYSVPTYHYEEPKQLSFFDSAPKSHDVILEVCYMEADGVERMGFVVADTKAEAWVEFFMSYPNVCFDMIFDYWFS